MHAAEPLRRWQFSSDLEEEEEEPEDKETEAAAPLPSVPVEPAPPPTQRHRRPSAVWERNVHPFVSPRPLDPQFQLPSAQTYKFQGQFDRRTRRCWPKRWTPEWWHVQFGILHICSSDDPFFVTLCIPLHCIQSLEVIRQRAATTPLFELQYVRQHKGKLRPVTIVCRAKTEADAEHAVTSIMRLCERAAVLGRRWQDYVERVHAQTAIQRLFDVAKNAGLYELVTHVGHGVASQHLDLCREAFHAWREWNRRERDAAREKTLRTEVTEARDAAEAATTEAAAKLALARHVLRLSQLAEVVGQMERSRKMDALLAFRRFAVYAKTHAAARNLADIFTHAIVVDREVSGKRIVVERRRRLAAVLCWGIHARLAWGFQALRNHTQRARFREAAQAHAMQQFLDGKEIRRPACLMAYLYAWRDVARLRCRQEEALRKVLTAIRQGKLQHALRKWGACCILQTQYDVRATRAIAATLEGRTTRLLRLAFTHLRSWTVAHQQVQALEAAVEAARSNAILSASYNEVPKERGCHALARCIHAASSARQAQAFHRFYTAAVRRKLIVRALPLFLVLLDNMSTHRKRTAFSQLVKVCARRPAAARLWNVHFAWVLRALVERRLRTALKTLAQVRPPHLPPSGRRPSHALSTTAAAESLVRALQRLSHARAVTALWTLRGHSHDVDVLRSIARAQCLERLANILERQLSIRLAAAFACMRCRAYPTWAHAPPLTVRTSLPPSQPPGPPVGVTAVGLTAAPPLYSAAIWAPALWQPAAVVAAARPPQPPSHLPAPHAPVGTLSQIPQRRHRRGCALPPVSTGIRVDPLVDFVPFRPQSHTQLTCVSRRPEGSRLQNTAARPPATSTGDSPDFDVTRDFVFDDIPVTRALNDIDFLTHLIEAERLLDGRVPSSTGSSSETPGPPRESVPKNVGAGDAWKASRAPHRFAAGQRRETPTTVRRDVASKKQTHGGSSSKNTNNAYCSRPAQRLRPA